MNARSSDFIGRTPRHGRPRHFLIVILFVGLFSARWHESARAALQPDEILLLYNRAVPDSAVLARTYAMARGVPLDQMLELNLPPTDEIAFESYDRGVTPAVRSFLREHHLERKIRSIVTVYGVPLRIGQRINAPRDNNELTQLRQLFRKLVQRISKLADEAETDASKFDLNFKPIPADQGGNSALRLQRALESLQAAANNPALPTVAEARQALQDMARRLKAPVAEALDDAFSTTAGSSATAPTTNLAAATQQAVAITGLVEKPFDAPARAELRDVARRGAGLVIYTRVIENQIEYLTPDASGAAFDSELALLWWPAYSRSRWQPNPLSVDYKGPPTLPVLMTMRIDGPSPQSVRNLIADSIGVERAGLQGKVVIDARGMAPADANGKPDAYGIFDQRLRDLAALLKAKTALQVVLDNNPDVLPPKSVDDVALYCGWYSVGHYVPGMVFNRGAVGYHAASFELLSLRALKQTGWVRGLMDSGVIGTLGSVAEPYLHSFPPPDEFFPLLLTGKLTLAEVYWRTTPLASWMQCCVGDPLYTPYAKNPQFKWEDLPDKIRTAIQAPPTTGR